MDFFTVAFIVAPFAMVAGGTISATQIYRPQNVIAWGISTLHSLEFHILTSISSSVHDTRAGSYDTHSRLVSEVHMGTSVRYSHLIS